MQSQLAVQLLRTMKQEQQTSVAALTPGSSFFGTGKFHLLLFLPLKAELDRDGTLAQHARGINRGSSSRQELKQKEPSYLACGVPDLELIPAVRVSE